MADRIGQQLGNYRLVRLIGTGGFAEVYLGEHVHLGTQAAIKLLQTHLAAAGEIEKFRTEAQTIVTLQHSNIVRVLDFGIEAGIPYLVMDYAPNGSLRSRLPAETPLPAATILPLLLHVSSALHYAHERKLIHRDIKPENLLVGLNQEVLLSDFGIAVVAHNTSQQRTQGVAGTAAYMAPEQLQGKPRPSSDLYALGVVVYEWLCGERPFQGGPIEVATQHLLTPPPPLREKVPGIPEAIEQVVLTALAKDPRERFGSVRAFANAFQQACGEAGTAYLLSTHPFLPLAPATLPAPLQASQNDSPVGSAPAGVSMDPAEASIFSATTHITPLFTPSLAAPSLYTAETRLISPDAPTNAANGEANKSGAPGEPVSSTPPAQGRAAQPSPAGTDASMLATAETAYQGSRPAAASDEVTLGETPGSPGGRAPEARKGRRKGGFRRLALVAAACLLALALIGSSVAYGLPLLLHAASTGSSKAPSTSSPTSVPAATGATVTITPASSDVKNTFNLTGVTGSPNASQQQVGARMISVRTQSYSQTVNDTGTGTTPGTQAHTIFDVYNNMTTNLNIAAGASYPNMGCAGNRTIVLDASVSVVPSSATYNVPGHIAEVGPVNVSGCSQPIQYTSGNCGGYACVFINAHIVDNFTNGTNPQTYTVVQQSDIDNAANNLISTNQPDAQQVVQSKLQANEQLVGTPQCPHHTSADHHAGDRADTVTVTVSFTCTGEAYDHDGALALAQQLLTGQAANTPGAGYAPVGQIKTTLVSATPGSQGTVQIVVQAEGIWAYQFSVAQQQTLAQLIAGKSVQDAQNVLAAQSGVAQASIQIAGGNGQTLPTDPSLITLVIQPVAGL